MNTDDPMVGWTIVSVDDSTILCERNGRRRRYEIWPIQVSDLLELLKDHPESIPTIETWNAIKKLIQELNV